MARVASIVGTGVRPEPLGCITVEAVPESVALVRRLFRELTGAHGLGFPVDDCVLLVSELVTNAVDHVDRAAGDGARQIRVDWWRVRDGLRVDVHSGGPPEGIRLRRPRDDDPRGRGLLLVDLLTDAWAVEPSRHGGTMVSFVIENVWRPTRPPVRSA
ncbi:ATP-binding protein [Streptomyces syringium]|uniref:ATP-binding protein n=1 Tax=Streptomyces syringium TaxID=76729 RepID=UPI003AAC2014